MHHNESPLGLLLSLAIGISAFWFLIYAVLGKCSTWAQKTFKQITTSTLRGAAKLLKQFVTYCFKKLWTAIFPKKKPAKVKLRPRPRATP
jgi:hypothetical protein